MKLYLSSYHLCKEPARLSSLPAKNKRVAVVRNALDLHTDAVRLKAGLDGELRDLAAIGLIAEPLDLRHFFGKTDELETHLNEFGYLWVTGGNTFVLRRAFAQSGLDMILKRKLTEDDFVYSGYSAGVCVITPTLEGIHIADEPQAVPAGYSSEIIWAGLNLVPFCIAPHYRSDHFESALIEKSVEYFIEHKIPFIALHDGESLLLDTTVEPVVPADIRGEGSFHGPPHLPRPECS
jgi:dipeptidase E